MDSKFVQPQSIELLNLKNDEKVDEPRKVQRPSGTVLLQVVMIFAVYRPNY